MKYAVLICGVEDEWARMDEATAGQAMSEISAWVRKWRDAGKILPGGEELDRVAKAKTVRPGPDGPVVTDGPYLELKEVVGGFLVLEAGDIDEAVAIAATWPALRGSTSVEIRPVME